MSTKNLGKPCHSLVTTPRQSCDFLALRGLPTDTSSCWALAGLAGVVAHLRVLGRLGFGQTAYHQAFAATLTSRSICRSGLSGARLLTEHYMSPMPNKLQGTEHNSWQSWQPGSTQTFAYLEAHKDPSSPQLCWLRATAAPRRAAVGGLRWRPGGRSCPRSPDNHS